MSAGRCRSIAKCSSSTEHEEVAACLIRLNTSVRSACCGSAAASLTMSASTEHRSTGTNISRYCSKSSTTAGRMAPESAASGSTPFPANRVSRSKNRTGTCRWPICSSGSERRSRRARIPSPPRSGGITRSAANSTSAICDTARSGGADWKRVIRSSARTPA